MSTDPTRQAAAALRQNLRELLELEQASGVSDWPHGRAPAAAAKPAAPAIVKTAAAAPRVQAQPHAAPAAHSHVIDDPAASPADRLTAIAKQIAACTACGLCERRQNTVPGEGAVQPEVCFIGEGPGADEDASGRPFVGAAGQLLTKMIAAMGFAREQVFICNVVKCRPPGNRTPEPAEVSACLPYLEAQVRALKPKVICTLGNTPLKALTGRPELGITRMRGQTFTWHGITCVPTFHPSYLLRSPEMKGAAWQDLKAVLALLGREPPARSGKAD